MKIAIATDDYKIVTGHIGRCNGFLIVEVKDGNIIKTEKRDNKFTSHGRGSRHQGEERHGMGHGEEHKDGHQRLAEGLSDCSHLICAGAGWRVQDDLEKAGVQVILTSETNCETAAINLEKGTLESNPDLSCNSH